MNRHTIASLYKKEILDIIRDKKTMLMMIVIPLIIYPLIFVASFWFASSATKESVTRTYNVAIYNVPEGEELQSFITKKSIDYQYKFLFVDLKDKNVEALLKDQVVDAYIIYEEGDELPTYTIEYLSAENNSATAMTMLQNMLVEYNNTLRDDMLRSYGIDPEVVLKRIDIKTKDNATAEESVGSIFGMIIPFLLITSVLMGAMYPAIDTTAGEKERGTLETLLTMPVKNIELITSKFLATSTIAMGAAVLNVFSMAILGAYFYETISASFEGDVSFSISSYIPAIAITMLAALVFAMLASAICLVVCIFAKSFKEAQNYTTPVMLVFMFAAMASMLPSIELNSKTALVPVVNITLLIGNLFAFKFNYSLIVTVLLVNLAFTVLAVLFMTKVFSSENILFGDSTAGIKLIEKRSDMKEKQMPGMGDLLLVISIFVLILFFVSSLAVAKYGIYGLMLEQTLFLLLPIGYAVYIKADIKKLFSLRLPSFRGFFGSIILFAGAYLLMLVISAIISYLFPHAGADNSVSLLWTNESFALIVISSALFPAICEEAMFRGFILGTLSDKYKPVTAVICTGVLFGLSHLAPVNIVIISILGTAMAYCVYRTRSILVSVVMHFLNNFIASFISCKPKLAVKLMPFLAKETIPTTTMIMIGVGGILLVVIGVMVIGKKNKANE